MVHRRLKIKKMVRGSGKKIVSARLTVAEYDAVQAKARFYGVTLGEWVRHASVFLKPKSDHLELVQKKKGGFYGEEKESWREGIELGYSEDWTDDL